MRPGRSGRPPFLLSGVDAGLDGILEGGAKEGAALVEGLPLAKGDDLAGGGGLG